MNRNTESHFANLPGINIGRSKFDRSFTHKCTFNASELVPVYLDCDIIPGDTVHMKQSEVVRMMTPVCPVMDNAYLDFYWFFIPNRLVWADFKKFMGENETAPWTQTGDYQVPQIKMSTEGGTTSNPTWTNLTGSIYEKMGVPPQNWNGGISSGLGYKEIKVSALPARAYCLVWNEFFRDENLQNPVNISKTSGDVNMLNTNMSGWTTDKDATIVSYEQRGGLPPLKVCKPHDYFTSCLPGAQKGPAVSIPLTTDDGMVKWKGLSASASSTANGENVYIHFDQDGATPKVEMGYHDNTVPGDVVFANEDGGNLFVDLQNATGATITQLRQAFAIQKFYERDARGGTRYIESVWSHFGVRNPDYRLQRPEYLGGWRQIINCNQVVQTSYSSDTDYPLGQTGAYSLTTHKDADVFTHSFTEHGILLGLCCVRTDHTYQQGINRMWFKKKRLDFYSPEFANLSEQAVLNREIYAQGTSADEEAFGYQECWAEMRYMPDIVTGELSSWVTDPLSQWHYADWYNEKPTLGDKWIQETDVNIKRTLAVQDHDQFFGDFFFGAIYTRPMPLYSIPGLIDHH